LQKLQQRELVRRDVRILPEIAAAVLPHDYLQGLTIRPHQLERRHLR